MMAAVAMRVTGVSFRSLYTDLGFSPRANFMACRGLDHHLVHPAAVGLEGGKLAGDGVGRAGAGEHRGHAPLPGLPEAPVQGVHPVDGPQLGGAGVGGLVAVVGLKAQGVPEQAQVAVGVDEAGEDVPPLRVQPLPGVPAGRASMGPTAVILSPSEGHKAPGDHRAVHGVYHPVVNEHAAAPFDKSSV